MNKLSKSKILLESGTNELELMEFTINGRHFGINIAKVLEIMQYTNIIPMPNSNPYVEGIFKPRENIITVIDLPTYMGLSKNKDTTRDILIITIFNNAYVAFHVDTVEEIHRVSWEKIEKPDTTIYSGEESLVTGIARFNNKLITILDFEKVLSDINPTKSIQISSIKELGEREESEKPILVVEDSPFLKKLLFDCLNKSKYTNINTCSNGKEAWDLLQDYKNKNDNIEKYVKCIVTDIEMPQMDGHKLLKLIREDEKLNNLPVIIFSSLINNEMKEKGKKLGATAQITKPEINELIRLIDKHIL